VVLEEECEPVARPERLQDSVGLIEQEVIGMDGFGVESRVDMGKSSTARRFDRDGEQAFVALTDGNALL
jgi:hypothetical protein